MTPETTDLHAITQRLDRLERQNRWLKRLGAIVLVALGAVIAMGQAPAKRTVVADEFVLKDSTGMKRAVLELERGQPMLTLFDANGKDRTLLGTDFISFMDSNNVPRALFGVGTMNFLSPSGEQRVSLGEERIAFQDSSGVERVSLGSSNAIAYKLVGGGTQVLGQGPGLMLFGADKKAMVDLREMPQGASLQLFGNEVNPNSGLREQVQVRLESSVDGPSLHLTDTQGFHTAVGSVSLATPSTGLSSRTSAASVVLFDKSGKSIWSAP
jgi:hypothetical protein